MHTAPLQKLGEIKFPEVNSAQLARLDPSIPYIILLPDRTPDRVVNELIAALGKANVLATVLVGEPKNFRLFASTPWSVTPQSFKKDVHPLKLEPASEFGKVLEKYFVSSEHEHYEAVTTLYSLVITNQVERSLAIMVIEEMVRAGILRFEILLHLGSVAPAEPNEVAKQIKSAKGPRRVPALPEVVMYPLASILESLQEFLNEDIKKGGDVPTAVQNLAIVVQSNGVTSSVEEEVLRLQNANVLMSGVLTHLRSNFPAPKAPAKKSAPAKKRVTKK